jgi:hypothetical protein|tara:strand:+ start:4364 stop:4771 length:408 start_codon:yes stop_codon:yes gene_type:complete
MRKIVLVIFFTLTFASVADAQTTIDNQKSCGEAQTTSITPNSETVTTSQNSINNTIVVAFKTGNATYWTAMLSTAGIDVSLSDNRGNAVVTFQKGLSIHMTANGSAGFTIFLSGKITDDSTEYSLTGAVLGTFLC